MVEVVNTRQFEEVEKPEDDLHNDPNNIDFSEEAQMEEVKTAEDEEEEDREDIEKAAEGSHLSSSKWSQLTRLLRLGLGRDAELPQGNSSKDGLLPGEMKPMEKRGSLGKIFRQGFSGFPRPVSARDPMKSEYAPSGAESAAAPTADAGGSPTNRKGTKWNVFKYRKSLHQLPESEEGAGKEEGGGKRRPLSKMLYGRTRSHKEGLNAAGASPTEASGGGAGGGGPPHTTEQPPPPQMPSSQSRIQSLGKLFRQNKNSNPEFLESTYDKNQPKPDAKKEIEW